MQVMESWHGVCEAGMKVVPPEAPFTMHRARHEEVAGCPQRMSLDILQNNPNSQPCPGWNRGYSRPGHQYLQTQPLTKTQARKERGLQVVLAPSSHDE